MLGSFSYNQVGLISTCILMRYIITLDVHLNGVMLPVSPFVVCETIKLLIDNYNFQHVEVHCIIIFGSSINNITETK